MNGRLKERELKLLSELMKDSRESDRGIARKLGVSQPTVSRIRARLEKEGYIKEYTVIPDFNKLGYKIMAITLGFSRTLNTEASERTRKIILDGLKGKQFGFVMLERGMGLGFDGVIITYHKSYSSYYEFLKWLQRILPPDLLDVEKIDSFLISLDDKVRYLPLTFSKLAQELLSRGQKKE